MDKQTMKKLYDALHLGHSMALKVSAEYHKEFEGQYPATHKILDDQVQQIREAITLAEHSLSAQDEVLTDWQTRADQAESRFAEIQRGVGGLDRYGFDGTFGGDFGGDLNGPFVKVDEVRALFKPPRQPTGCTHNCNQGRDCTCG